MKTQKLLFIQGGGEEGHQADEALVVSLKKNLGTDYHINYPEIRSDETSADFGWTEQIGKEISKMNNDFILAGHSFGASMILKYLSENSVEKNIKGIFLLATPFWNGNEDWQSGLKLPVDFAEKLPEVPIFLYHCMDDEEIPISHFDHYEQKLAAASFREIKTGGHQFKNGLRTVADDIQSI